MTEALSGALTATQLRLTSGLADAEAELVRARLRCRELRAVVALARAQADAAPTTPAPRFLEQTRTRASAYSLVTPVAAVPPAKVSLPRRWVPALAAFRRLDVDRIADAFAPNTIFHWEGDNPLAGMHLGRKDAIEVASRIAQLIEPGTVRALELSEADGTLELLAQVTFGGSLPHLVRLQTRIHCVIRFDDAGRVALLYATPDDAEAVDAYLNLAVSD